MTRTVSSLCGLSYTLMKQLQRLKLRQRQLGKLVFSVIKAKETKIQTRSLISAPSNKSRVSILHTFLYLQPEVSTAVGEGRKRRPVGTRIKADKTRFTCSCSLKAVETHPDKIQFSLNLSQPGVGWKSSTSHELNKNRRSFQHTHTNKADG